MSPSHSVLTLDCVSPDHGWKSLHTSEKVGFNLIVGLPPTWLAVSFILIIVTCFLDDFSAQ